MTLTHDHTNGAAVASSPALLAERVRAIGPDLQHQFEGYLGEILGSLGMDLNEPSTAETAWSTPTNEPCVRSRPGISPPLWRPEP